MVGGDDAHSCKGPDRTRFSRKAQGWAVYGHRIAQVGELRSSMLAIWLTARSAARVYINFVHGLLTSTQYSMPSLRTSRSHQSYLTVNTADWNLLFVASESFRRPANGRKAKVVR